jgi:tRNA(fMet)-specific endonuclease VapC
LTLKYLLDTSTVSAPIAKRPDAGILKQLRLHGAECAIAAPVWHELVFGTSGLPAGPRRDQLETYLRTVVEPSFPILAYDATAAAWHGRERARLEAAGQITPFVDGQIAAIAFSYGLSLVTANTRHFASFRGVRIADWSR